MRAGVCLSVCVGSFVLSFVVRACVVLVLVH